MLKDGHPPRLPSWLFGSYRLQKTRRRFLKTAAVALAGAALSGCIPPPTPTQPPFLETATPAHEQPFTKEVKVIKDFERIAQTVEGVQSATEIRFTDCYFPPDAPPLPRSGFIYEPEPPQWDIEGLPKITVNGEKVPVLKLYRPDRLPLSELENWYREPTFIQRLIQKVELPRRPKSIGALFVHYKSVRDKYFGPDCHIVYSNKPTHDPKELYSEMTKFIAKHTKGAVQYVRVDEAYITEEDLPLITNRESNRTLPALIDAYGQSMDYQTIAEKTLKARATSAFVFGGPSTGMFESFIWPEQNTGIPVSIFGLNYERPLEDALHSWMHFLESTLYASPLNEIAQLVFGRGNETDMAVLPTEQLEAVTAQFLQANSFYAAAGLGTVHFPPNAFNDYQCDSPLPVVVPGLPEPITSQAWEKSVTGYFGWLLENVPEQFFSVIS